MLRQGFLLWYFSCTHELFSLTLSRLFVFSSFSDSCGLFVIFILRVCCVLRYLIRTGNAPWPRLTWRRRRMRRGKLDGEWNETIAQSNIIARYCATRGNIVYQHTYINQTRYWRITMMMTRRFINTHKMKLMESRWRWYVDSAGLDSSSLASHPERQLWPLNWESRNHTERTITRTLFIWQRLGQSKNWSQTVLKNIHIGTNGTTSKLEKCNIMFPSTNNTHNEKLITTSSPRDRDFRTSNPRSRPPFPTFRF